VEVSVTVNVTAVHALIRSHPARINRAMRAALNDSTAVLLRDMRQYPAQRPGSTYRRTKTLFKSWSRRPPEGVGLDMYAVVGSDSGAAPYNIRVQHPDFQAAVHVGRWQTTRTVQRARQDDIQRFFDVRMREAFADA
jgi:hypothetical protein